METKKCAKCGQELTLEAFSKNSGNKDGLHSYCKDCLKDYRDLKKSNTEGGNLKKVFTSPELSRFTPRQLIDEIKARGYKGTLTYEQVIVL